MKGQTFKLPSKTIPDETLSIKQILERYARGLPIGGGRVPIYEGEDNDLPDPRTLDLAERQEMAESFREQLDMFNDQQRAKQLPKQSAPAPAKEVERSEAKEPTDPPKS